MALPAKRIVPEIPMEDRIVRLEDRFERLQVDVTDMKADIRRVDGKVDALRDSVTTLQGEMKDGFIALVNRMVESERAIRVEFKADMQQLRTELTTDAQQLRTDLKTDAQQLRTELKTDAQHLRTELKTDAQHLRTELKTDAQHLRTELNTDMQQLRADFQKGMDEVRKDNTVLFRAGISACAFILAALAAGYIGLQAQLNKLISEPPAAAASAPQRNRRDHQTLLLPRRSHAEFMDELVPAGSALVGKA
jgi:F0F1-type ATP synthase membrane subunit b/b'